MVVFFMNRKGKALSLHFFVLFVYDALTVDNGRQCSRQEVQASGKNDMHWVNFEIEG